MAGGNPCTPSGNTLSCSVGSLAPQATRAITLNLTPQQAGTPTLAVALTASNDASAGNDNAQVSFTVDPSADLEVAVSARPASFVSGGTTQFTVTVRHLAGDPVSDARLSFEVPDGLSGHGGRQQRARLHACRARRSPARRPRSRPATRSRSR